MPQAHALRLAQLHNHEDSVHHDLTTRDKVSTNYNYKKTYSEPLIQFFSNILYLCFYGGYFLSI